mmetsp:Transcript_12433/g.37402  ORF Transcript_12433/g.37402 Transcript_12433/m.37402 type:complete len:85 (+) Transcript_12433:242-496(+)
MCVPHAIWRDQQWEASDELCGAFVPFRRRSLTQNSTQVKKHLPQLPPQEVPSARCTGTRRDAVGKPLALPLVCCLDAGVVTRCT